MKITTAALKQSLSVLESNVLEIIGLAHKYQVDPLLPKCKTMLDKWIDDCYNQAGPGYNLQQLSYLLICFKILKTGILYDFTELCNKCKNVISKFPTIYYYGTEDYFLRVVESKQRKISYPYSNNVKLDDELLQQRDECAKQFMSLSLEIQRTILFTRVCLFDDLTRK